MQMAIRALVGILGLAGVLIALRIWMAPAEFAAQMGVAANGSLGIATLRADMGGFFGAGGLIALLAAIRNRGSLLLAPLVLIGIAFAGRFLTIATDGFSQDMVPPMIIEAVLLVVFGIGRAKLPR